MRTGPNSAHAAQPPNRAQRRVPIQRQALLWIRRSAFVHSAFIRQSAFSIQHSLLLLLLLLTIPSAGVVRAHHGSAEYDVTREVTLRGRVAEFRWVNPHVRIVVESPDETGALAMWDCEGPPLSWAAQRGWTGGTLRPGETVSIVMYPPKGTRRTGLVKRIERANGEVLAVSRPWLDGG